MTRTQAEENLKNLGFEEVTAEMITNYLNQVNGEAQKEKDRANKYKEQAELADKLQAQIDEINNQNLSDIELANKEKETANSKVAELEAKLQTMQLRTSLAENGIVGEDADSLLESLNGGGLDASILGKIISAKVTEATALKEKELLENTPNPSGSKGGEPEKTSAEKIAESVGKSLGGGDKASADIISNYL